MRRPDVVQMQTVGAGATAHAAARRQMASVPAAPRRRLAILASHRLFSLAVVLAQVDVRGVRAHACAALVNSPAIFVSIPARLVSANYGFRLR